MHDQPFGLDPSRMTARGIHLALDRLAEELAQPRTGGDGLRRRARALAEHAQCVQELRCRGVQTQMDLSAATPPHWAEMPW